MIKHSLLAAIILGTLLASCSNPQQVTKSDLSHIGIELFVVQLPADLDSDQALFLELLGEEGVVSRKPILLRHTGETPEYLKIFMNAKDPSKPHFSYVLPGASIHHTLDLGDAKLRAWSDSEVFRVGECFAFCSIDDSTGHSDIPRGDDSAIRVTIGGE
jgi:hypothetical protein